MDNKKEEWLRQARERIKVQIGSLIYPLANDEWIINERLLLPDIAFFAIRLSYHPIPKLGWPVTIKNPAGLLFKGKLMHLQPNTDTPDIYNLQCVDDFQNARGIDQIPLKTTMAIPLKEFKRPALPYPSDPQPIRVDVYKLLSFSKELAVYEDYPSSSEVIGIDIGKLMVEGIGLPNQISNEHFKDTTIDTLCRQCKQPMLLRLIEHGLLNWLPNGIVFHIVGYLGCPQCDGVNCFAKKISSFFFIHGGAIHCTNPYSKGCTKIASFYIPEWKFLCPSCAKERSDRLKLQVDPITKASFNQRAEEIFTEFQEKPQTFSKPVSSSRYSFFSSTIAEGTQPTLSGLEQLNDFRFIFSDQTEKYFVIFLKHNSKVFGLHLDIYNKAERLAKDICKLFQDKLSVKTCSSMLFNWVKDKHCSIAEQLMMDYFISKGEKLIEELEVWVPISIKGVETVFTIGQVVIRPLTKTLISKWHQGFQDRIATKEKLLGYAVGIITVVAEAQLSKDLATKNVEEATDILRFFLAPTYFSTLNPIFVSTCTIFGKEPMRKTLYYMVKEGICTQGIESVVDGEAQVEFAQLNSKDIDVIKKLGLDQINLILNKIERTDFQNSLLNSITLFSRGFLVKQPIERMFYLISSIESLLVKDIRTSTSKIVSERMAIIIGKDFEERKEIIENFIGVYDKHSDMFHHVKSEIDEDVAKAFKFCILNIWLCLQYLIKCVDLFDKKEDMINFVENHRLSNKPLFGEGNSK